MQTDEVTPIDTEAQIRDARAQQSGLPESSKGADAAAEDAPLVCNHLIVMSPYQWLRSS